MAHRTLAIYHLVANRIVYQGVFVLIGFNRLWRLYPDSIAFPLKLLDHVLAQFKLVTVVTNAGTYFGCRHVRLMIYFFQISVHTVILLHEEIVQASFFGDFACTIELSLGKVCVYIDMRLLTRIDERCDRSGGGLLNRLKTDMIR